MDAGKDSRALNPGWIALAALSILISSCATTSRQAQHASTQGSGRCEALTTADRKEILRLAQPQNFPKARYKKRWNDARPIEQETDCSKFVHEIYRRAGLPFPRANTHELRYSRHFREVPERFARPGDLVVFPKHVGILANDGQVISATIGGTGRGRHLAMRSHKDPRFRSSIVKAPKEQFSKRYMFLQYACKQPDED